MLQKPKKQEAPNFGLGMEARLLPSVSRFHAQTDVIMQALRVALPAVVQEFQPGPPATVTVLVATNEYLLLNDPPEPEPPAPPIAVWLKTKALPLPLLVNVPAVFPSAGGWNLTFPIQPGDECLLVFADTQLDIWWQNGGTGNNPISQRRHDLSDAVAVFGLRSTPRGLANYSTSSAQLRSDDGSVVIDLAEGQITVTAPTVTVNAQTANVNGSDEVNVSGANVNVNGSDEVNLTGGTVTIGPTTKIDDRVFLAHTHPNGVGGSTGPVT